MTGPGLAVGPGERGVSKSRPACLPSACSRPRAFGRLRHALDTTPPVIAAPDLSRWLFDTTPVTVLFAIGTSAGPVDDHGR